MHRITHIKIFYTYFMHNLTSYLQDNLLDWSRPIFWQVGSLGDKYDQWVHSPIDSSLWLFENPIVEYFSKAYWWTVLLYWVPALSYLLYDACVKFTNSPVVWHILGIGGKLGFV